MEDKTHTSSLGEPGCGPDESARSAEDSARQSSEGVDDRSVEKQRDPGEMPAQAATGDAALGLPVSGSASSGQAGEPREPLRIAGSIPDFEPVGRIASSIPPEGLRLAEPIERTTARQPQYTYQVRMPSPGPQTTKPTPWFAPKPRRNGRARRWSNGYSLIAPRDNPGFGSLKVANGTDHDALVKLVADAEAGSGSGAGLCRFVYVCARSTVTILGIGAGSYTLLFCVGKHWDKTRKAFSAPAAAVKFEDPLAFTEEPSPSGLRYVRAEVTLHPVSNGRALTTRFDQQSFDALQ